MVDKFSYKVIALFLAIFIYIFLVYALVFGVFKDDKKKKDYGFNVDEAVVVNIDTLVPDTPKVIKKPKPVVKSPKIPVRAMPIEHVVPVEKPIEKKPEPPKEVTKPEPEVVKEVKKESRDKEAKSAKDLFSTIRTDKYQKAMQEKLKQEKARASRLKKQKAKEARKKSREAKKRKEKQTKAKRRAQQMLEELQISQSTSKHRKKGENDKFWSYVSDKIMSKWQRTISTQNGLHATVIIRIDNRGKLTYHNLKSSYNSLFDTKLKVFLDNLEYTRFPAYKDGSYIEAEFEFKDKDKGL